MADGYALDIHKGIRAALVADATIATLVGVRVYDEPPEQHTSGGENIDGPQYPFIRFGDIIPTPADTDGSESAFVSVAIEAHSQPVSGRGEATQIIEAVRAALHRKETNVSLSAHTLVELIEQTSRVTKNSDGQSYTGVAVYRAYLDV